jgi:hypothetical protein
MSFFGETGRLTYGAPARGRGSGTYAILYGMKRTTVHLPEELKGQLERAARISGLSEAHLIREGVQRVIELYGSPHPRIPLFESKDPTLAERADELLAGFGET